MDNSYLLGLIPGLVGSQSSGQNPLNRMLFGQDQQQNQRFDPTQRGQQQQLASMGLGGLQDNQFDFGPIEQQARTNFQSQTLPSLMSRFTSMGEGTQRSSGFQGAVGAAGAGLEESLAGMKQHYGMQEQGNLFKMLQMGLQSPYGQQQTAGSSGGLGNILSDVKAEDIVKLITMLSSLF